LAGEGSFTPESESTCKVFLFFFGLLFLAGRGFDSSSLDEDSRGTSAGGSECADIGVSFGLLRDVEVPVSRLRETPFEELPSPYGRAE